MEEKQWKRKQLKERAKMVIKKNYWTIVIVCFVLGVCTGQFGMSTVSLERNFESADISNKAIEDEFIFNGIKSVEGEELIPKVYNQIEDLINSHLNSAVKSQKYIYKIVDAVKIIYEDVNKKEAIMLFIAALLAFLVIIFVIEPLKVGGKRFFIKVKRSTNTSVGILISVFKKGEWGNITKIMLIKNVFLTLWYLTIVGGIIKTYEYMMIPYILGENPNVKEKEAFALSKQMMKGNKWKAFVLDLSFLLWDILSIITLGIVGVLYVNPYTEATKAELYFALKRKAIKEKYIYCEKLVKEKVA